MTVRYLLLLILFFSGSEKGLATTVLPPDNLVQLAQESDCVVLGSVQSVRSVKRGVLPYRSVIIHVSSVIMGPVSAGDSLKVLIPGGFIGSRQWLVAGSPELAESNTYLLFLRKTAHNLWRLWMLSFGCFRETLDKNEISVLVPLREARNLRAVSGEPLGDPRLCGPFRTDRLISHLGDVLDGKVAWSPAEILASPETIDVEVRDAENNEKGDSGNKGGTDDCLFFSNHLGWDYRWNTFDSGRTIRIAATRDGIETLPVGGAALVLEALNVWSDVPDTRLNLTFGGTVSTSPVCTESERDFTADTLVFGDPCNDIEDLIQCSGVLAYGGPLVEGTHRFDRKRWGTITGWMVVVNNGSECVGTDLFRLMLAHELGHGLGFQHFEDSSSLMHENCCNPINELDELCAQFAYPAFTPGNQRPGVSIGNGKHEIVYGPTITINAVVSDDGLPVNPGDVSVSWTVLHGPGGVMFSKVNSPETDVTFSSSGDYLLGVTASDGELIRMASLFVTVYVDAQVPFLRGDANDDGSVDLSDPVLLILYLFDSDSIVCPDAADFNDDGVLNLGDPVYGLTYLFADGIQPPAPWPVCGEDDSEDDLPDCSAERCRNGIH